MCSGTEFLGLSPFPGLLPSRCLPGTIHLHPGQFLPWLFLFILILSPEFLELNLILRQASCQCWLLTPTPWVQCYDYPHPAAEKTKAEGSRSVGEHRPEHKVNKGCAVEFSQGLTMVLKYLVFTHLRGTVILREACWKSGSQVSLGPLVLLS